MSIFDHPDDVASVPSWRCPHCGTLQAETARCWACSLSTATCATCQLFRTAVVDGLGYCAADRSRAPLVGDEVRPCWQEVEGLVDLEGGILAGATAPSPLPAPVRPTVPLGDTATPTSTGSEPGSGPHGTTEPVVSATHSLAEGLIDAPVVEPSRRISSEAERRARAGQDRPDFT